MSALSVVQRIARLGAAAVAGLAFLPALLTRLLMGEAFFLTGRGKLANFDNTVQFFASLGIPLPELGSFRIMSETDFFYLIFGFVLLGAYVAHRLTQSKIGRTFSAIREDELAAEAMGVPVNRYKIWAFIISAIYAGLAGALYGTFSGVASPDNFTFDDSVGFLCMSVIGGNRTIGGAVIGAFMLTFLSEALRAFQAFRLVIYGAILIFTVIYMPQGLAGLFGRWPAKGFGAGGRDSK